MPNIAQAISGHNTQVLNEDQPVAQQSGCNCDNGPASCPVQGKCKSTGVVYEARVTETVSGKAETYKGLTCRTFKRSNNLQLDYKKMQALPKGKVFYYVQERKQHP